MPSIGVQKVYGDILLVGQQSGAHVIGRSISKATAEANFGANKTCNVAFSDIRFKTSAVY